MEKTVISFPGLGIEPFEIAREAFSIGNFAIYWYALLIVTGIALAVLYTKYRSEREGVSVDNLLDIALLTVGLGVIGARLYYVLTTLDSGAYQSFGDVINIRNGGLGIYGGIIGGVIGIMIMCKIRKVNVLSVFDAAAPGVMIAQAIGRWGNFCNGEAYGSQIVDGKITYAFLGPEKTFAVSENNILYKLRMGLESSSTHTDSSLVGKGMVEVQPTFLYESLWNILGFVLINLIFKKKKFNGQIALMYFAWYGFGRMFLEGLRTDSLFIPGTGIRISQMLGLVLCVAAVAALIVGFVFAAKKKLAKAFVPGFIPDVKAFREEQKRIEAERVAAKKAERAARFAKPEPEEQPEEEIPEDEEQTPKEEEHGDDH
ncbi:MAG: prolipoprotein diacylglyceryl transferase [Clostridia bacterium]|nr:prolipoprotein diacylglyceryl transferase [Clostridia bacterium]